MKLALLGTTPAAIAFAVRAAQLGHEVIAAYEAQDKAQLREALPTVAFREDWENLLGARDVDAVVVAGPILPEDLPANERERRDDQLRKLFQAAVPLIVLPPVCEAIVGFELEMIRRDVQGAVIPALATPLHAWLHLAEWLTEKSASALGPIEVVQVERCLAVRQRPEVLAAFARDAELLRRIAGPLKRLTASGGKQSAERKASLASLVVQAEGESAFPVRWSVAPVGEFDGAKVRIVGSSGEVVLEMPSAGNWRLRGPGLMEEYEPPDEAETALEELERSLAVRKLDEPSASSPLTWLNACRAVEAMEAIDRSLARNRAVDLYNEDHSEESSFKGIMAASGCLMLLGTLAALTCAGALTVVAKPEKGSGGTYWGWLQVCLIVPLALFLLAQLLSFGL